MLGFSPFKKHANKFNYTPRYYDPEQEARAVRRAELHGVRGDESKEEYRPGQYIRTKRSARVMRRKEEDQKGRARIWYTMGGAVLLLLFLYILYPRLVAVFIRASSGAPVQTEQVKPAAAEFDPSVPITIVPNDYQE